MRVRVHVVGLLSLCGMVSFVGCGDDRQVVHTQPQVQSSPPPPSVQGGKNSEVAFGEAGSESSGSTAETTQAAEPVEPLPRPEDVSQWSRREITFAIEERDLRVLEALVHYATAHLEHEQAAFDFISWMDLLTQPARASTDPAAVTKIQDVNYDSPLLSLQMNSNRGFGDVRQEGGPIGGGVFGKEEIIAEALFTKLVSLQTLTGYQLARDILAGDANLEIEDEFSVRLVLTSLLKNCSGPNCPGAKLLKQALLTADDLRSGNLELDAAQLQQIGIEELWKNSLCVVDGLMGLSTWQVMQMHHRHPSAAFASDRGFGDEGPTIEIRPDGAIVNGGNTGEQAFRQQIIKNLGLPRYSQTEAIQASSYLWSDTVIEALLAQVSLSEALMKEPDLLLLMGQIPATPTRHSLQQYLENHWRLTEDWTQNPLEMVNAELFQSQYRDPGLMLSLKSLPRQQPIVPGQPVQRGRKGELPGANQPDEDEIGPVELKSMNLWFEAGAQMMLSLMNRMQLAAARQTLPPSNSDELDVKLHRDAEPIYDARLELTRDHSATSPMADRTTVNYVRMEMTQIDDRTLKHYELAVRNENVFSILNNNGMWIEYSGLDRRTGEMVSTDILISKNRARRSVVQEQKKSEATAGEAEASLILSPGHPIVIEILTVRVPDPEEYLQQSKVTQK